MIIRSGDVCVHAKSLQSCPTLCNPIRKPASLLTFLPYLKPGLVLTRTLGRTALRVRLPLGPGLPLSLVGQVRAAAAQPQSVQRGGSDGVGQGASGFFSSSFSFNNVF